MASFTPEQKDIILNRGFQGAEGNPPLIPVESHEISFDGFYFYEYNTLPQQIYNIGDIVEWCDGNINKSAIFWVSAITAESEDYYNNSVEIAVTIGNDGNGKGTIRIQFADKDDNPNISNYEGMVSKTSSGGDFLYSGNCYLCLAFVRGELLFTVSHELITALNYTPMRVVTTQGFTVVNGTQWGANQPFLYWMEQNNSDYYDPEAQVPEIEEGGGGGGFYRPSDTNWFSGLPALDILDFGIVSQYQVNTAAMMNLALYLWSDNFIDNIKKAWASPFENIINLSFVPLNSEIVGSNANIEIGNINTGVESKRIKKSLYAKDFGSINLKELYNNFADYSPYTKLSIYLPGCGIKNLNPDDYMDGTIYLIGYIDLFSGTIVYQTGSVRHGKRHIVDHYEGNIQTSIPITGANYFSAYQSAINGLAQMGSGNILGAANNFMNIKPDYGKASGVSGSAMRLSLQKPYIFFDTPQLKQAKQFRQLYGYVSNQYEKLGNCTGYVSIKYIDLSGVNAPESVKDRILEKLRAGVHIHAA